MSLLWIILVPALGGLIAWYLGGRLARWISLLAMLVDLVLCIGLWMQRPISPVGPGIGLWIAELDLPWFPALGISFHLGVDGLSLLMLLLTVWMGVLAIAGSWTEITERVGFFHFNLLWSLAAVMGAFLALDLFALYFFWELMLIPTYFLIGIWGHEDRIRAGVKFFIFTQASGLLLLIAAIGLAFAHRAQTGVFTFDYLQLLGTPLNAGYQLLLMLGFFIAFGVKLPAFPLHTWLPDAHTQAPTGGSVELAGLLLKVGPYAMLRFAVPLFPAASRDFVPVGMTLGVAGILYGAYLAYGQDDLKRLVAYTSVSHMGFVLVGVYAWSRVAHQGVVLQMIAHGLSTGGLFVLVGALQERLHTRDLTRMGGLWSLGPRFGGVMLFLAMASLGLPGFGNFAAEFLILLGVWQRRPAWSAVGALGLVLSAAYALIMVRRTFFGRTERAGLRDLTGREYGVLATTIAALLLLGLYPQPVIDTLAPFLDQMHGIMNRPVPVFPLE